MRRVRTCGRGSIPQFTFELVIIGITLELLNLLSAVNECKGAWRTVCLECRL